MADAPALLIFKDYGEEFLKLSQEEAGELLHAIAKFATGEKVNKDKLSRVVSLLFSIIEKDSARNEAKYKARQETNSKYYQNRKQVSKKSTKAKKKTTKTATNPTNSTKQAKQVKSKENPKENPSKEPEKAMTDEQAKFLEEFKRICPDKEIDCNLAEMPAVDYNSLLKEIKRSPQFLQKNKALNLKWCIDNAEKIIKGTYKNWSDSGGKHFANERNYTREECNSLFQDIDEIEV